MYCGCRESEGLNISRTQVGAKGGAITAVVVCRRHESESESKQVVKRGEEVNG